MSTEIIDPPDHYDQLLDPNYTGLEPPTDSEGQYHMVEAAARRRPNLQQVLGSIEKDSAGMYRPDEAESQKLIDALGEWQGFGRYVGDEKTLGGAVTKARKLVSDGLAKKFLHDLPFVDSEVVRDLSGNLRDQVVTLRGVRLAVSPDRIIGAQSFDSWQGRGREGSNVVSDRQTGEQRTSLEQIFDYATRETEIPPMDDPSIFITNEGAFVYAGNAHRAAAAKLRGEPIQVSTFSLHDLRGAALDVSQQHALAKAQIALSIS